jgi:hypothetical protein
LTTILRNLNLMKKFLIIFIAITSMATAQKKDITLNEIWNGSFSTERMNSLNSVNGYFYSFLNFADFLKGNFLLVHGSGDDNVHIQNTMRLTNALVEANKHFDLAIYPDRNHGIYTAKNTRLHLYEKMTRFIQNNL